MIVAVVIAMVLAVPVVADRVAAGLLERRVASALQCAAGLATAPDVSIGGFPALSQLATRRLDDVRASADDVSLGSVTLRRVSIEAHDLKLGDGISAGEISAEATVAWSALASLGSAWGAGSNSAGSGTAGDGTAGDGTAGGDSAGVGVPRIVGSDEAGRLVLQADVALRGLRLPATIYADLALSGGRLTVAPAEVEALGLRLPAAQLPAVARQGRSIDLPVLPAGLAYRDIAATDDGLQITVAGTNLTSTYTAGRQSGNGATGNDPTSSPAADGASGSGPGGTPTPGGSNLSSPSVMGGKNCGGME